MTVHLVHYFPTRTKQRQVPCHCRASDQVFPRCFGWSPMALCVGDLETRQRLMQSFSVISLFLHLLFHFHMHLHAQPLASLPQLQINLSSHLLPPALGFTCSFLWPTQLSLFPVDMRYVYLPWLVALAAAIPLTLDNRDSNNPKLQFNSDRKFSIIVFSDLHLGECKIHHKSSHQT
jgi:hypothetical protein